MKLRTSLAQVISIQRCIPYRLRRSCIKRLDPAWLKNHAFEADLLGLRFRGNVVNYIDRLIYFCGAHEKYMLFFLRDWVRKLHRDDLVFLDVGANAGNHSLYMSHLVSKVIACEPFERVRKQLLENIFLNHIANITVCPFGLGSENTKLPFYAAPESNLGAASFHADHKDSNYYLGDMEIRVGDELVNELSMPRISIMKADVEGFEKHVLLGLRHTLLKDRPLIIIELSEKTRATLTSEEEFFGLFPDDYAFYYFKRGKHDSGKYKLATFDYAFHPKIEDVIAVPKELEKFI